jgi:hypothetical protein
MSVDNNSFTLEDLDLWLGCDEKAGILVWQDSGLLGTAAGAAQKKIFSQNRDELKGLAISAAAEAFRICKWDKDDRVRNPKKTFSSHQEFYSYVYQTTRYRLLDIIRRENASISGNWQTLEDRKKPGRVSLDDQGRDSRIQGIEEEYLLLEQLFARRDYPEGIKQQALGVMTGFSAFLDRKKRTMSLLNQLQIMQSAIISSLEQIAFLLYQDKNSHREAYMKTLRREHKRKLRAHPKKIPSWTRDRLRKQFRLYLEQDGNNCFAKLREFL